MAKLPLEGIRVVEIGMAFTGPFIGMMLADLGAQVIRVESRQHWQTSTRGILPRPTREMLAMQVPFTGGYPDKEPGERPWNRWALFNCHSRNKLSMTVDLSRPEGIDIFKRLIKVTDIFAENNAATTMDKLDLSYEELIKVKPDLIMARAPGFGLSGPYSKWRSHGNQIDAVIGHQMLRGYTDVDATVRTAVYLSDYVCPVHATFAILAALHYRDRTGKGQMIESPAAEPTLPSLGEAIMDYTMNGRVQTSRGNRDILAAPQGCYRCKGEDRWVNISVFTDEQWKGLSRVLGEPDWTQEERFSTSLGRSQHHDELDQRIEEWTREHDHYAVMHMLQREGVPAGPVLDQRDEYNDPHLKDRGFFEEVFQEDCGTHRYPGMLWKLSQIPLGIRTPPVRLGEHNEYVYKEIIGVSEKEYEELEKAGHIGMDYVAAISGDA